MMAFCFLAFLRVGALLLSWQYFPLPLDIPSLSRSPLFPFLDVAAGITASGLFLLRFSFQTLLHQIMVAALPQQGKQQGAEAASECQRDDGSGCAVQLGPHKQAGEGQQQQSQGGDIAKQLPAEAGTHAAVQPV